MNFDKYKFRCSALGSIMTNQPGKKDTKDVSELSETAKEYLLECYICEVYGRDKEIISKYLTKGLDVEEDSITLYSRATKRFFKKNEDRLENDYISGLMDLFIGPSIKEAEEIIDIKSSWDIHTYFKSRTAKKVNKAYEYQLQGYMALTGAPTSKLVYCLVSTPHALIEDEKKKLQWKMGVSDPINNEVFLKACEYLDSSLKFDDIAIDERYIESKIARNNETINSIYNRVEICREFLNTFKP